MKSTLRLLLAMLTLTACADLAAPPALTELADAPFAAARSLSSGSTTLPTLGGNFAQAVAINDAGAVVGYAAKTNSSLTVAGVAYAAKWVRDPNDGRWMVKALGESLAPDGQTIYPSPGGRALAVNERGDAVGTRDGRALMWPAAGGEITLPDGAAAQGVNNAGIIVGGTVWGNTGIALVWTPNAGSESGWTARPLPLLLGGTSSHAFAINEGGVITGTASPFAGRSQAVIWLPTADGWSSPVALSGTEASIGSGGFSINAGGDVVGYFRTCDACIRAYFWPAGGGSPVNVTMLSSSTSSGHAKGIEDGRRVVGFVHVPRGNGFGSFLWTPGDAALTQLGTGEANDINNGTGRYGQEVVGFRRGSTGSQATVWRAP